MNKSSAINLRKQNEIKSNSAAEMRKQKLPLDHNIDKQGKIRKIETRDDIQRPKATISQSNINVRCEEMMASTSSINEPRELDRLKEIHKFSFQNDNISSFDRIRSTEMKDRLARAETKIKKLQKDLCQANEQNKTLLEHVDGKVKTQNEIIEKQNESLQLMSFIEGQTNILTDTLERCNESREHLTNLYDKLNSKQDEVKDLTERYKDRIREIDNLKEKLVLISNQLSNCQIELRRFENNIMEKSQLFSIVNNKVENFDTIIKEEEEKYVKEITEMTMSLNNFQEGLKIERDTKYKLVTENNESSMMIKDLLLKIQSLQLTSTEYEKQIVDLKSSILISNEKVTILHNDIAKLECTNLEIISNKDFQLSVYRKQLQDLRSMHTEAVDKLSKIITDNKNLSDTTIKTFEDIERLKNNLKNKDDELININMELTKTLDKNERLSIDIKTLNEELIEKEKIISQLRDDLKTHDATKEKYVKEEGEINIELVTIETKLKNKSDDISKILVTESEEKIKCSEKINDLKNVIEEKSKEIIVLKKSTENYQRELEYDESRYSSEIQHGIYLSKECKMFEHEKKIKKNNTKMDILNRELSDINEKLENLDKKETETDSKEKEKYDFELNELKSNCNELSDKILSIEKENETLDNQLKNIKTYNDDNFNQEIEMLRKSSSMMRISYQENESSPIKSHLKPILKSNLIESPFKVQKVRFDVASELILMNNINGLEMMEEAERRYRDSTVSNRPDQVKLQIPITTVEIETSPVANTSRRTSSRKFFKRTKPKDKDTLRLNEDSKDPYFFK